VSRRTSLPGTAELFRSTRDGELHETGEHADAPVAGLAQRLLAEPPVTSDRAAAASPAGASTVGVPTVGASPAGASGRGGATPARRRVVQDAERRPTGRERHDEKITVYVSPEELMDLERARLTLRGEHGLAVDRGRIVREALAVVLADLDDKGEGSILVRRLHGR